MAWPKKSSIGWCKCRTFVYRLAPRRSTSEESWKPCRRLQPNWALPMCWRAVSAPPAIGSESLPNLCAPTMATTSGLKPMIANRAISLSFSGLELGRLDKRDSAGAPSRFHRFHYFDGGWIAVQNLGNHARAEQQLRAAADRDPFFAYANFHLGNALYLAGKFQEAEGVL